MHITLVRHGRSAHVHGAGWLDRDGFLRWRESYESAGILESEVPPPELCGVAQKAALIVASDAPRAIASARMLAPDRELVIDPLLRELELAPPRIGIRLPLTLWAFSFVVRWLIRDSHASAEEHERARTAAQRLDALAKNHGSVLVATHGSFRALVAKRLVDLGWRHDEAKRTSRHWSAWTLTA